MNDLYKNLKLTAISAKPDVWVSRLVIYKRIESIPVSVRDISLDRGLNIIWATGSKKDDPTSKISGHSAGKTTFCRFIRYVLGEKNFGPNRAMELTRASMPHGYIAAEIHVRGQKWAVLRPIRERMQSFIEKGISVEDLIKRRPKSVSHENYIKEIGFTNTDNESGKAEITQSEYSIQWAHIIAWCARDQETRFQKFQDFRSLRSESDKLSFSLPNNGPFFIMRNLLGLIYPDELRGEMQLKNLHRNKNKINKLKSKKLEEYTFYIKLFKSQLIETLKLIMPDESNIEILEFNLNDLYKKDLMKLTEEGVKQINKLIKSEKLNQNELQKDLDELGAKIFQAESTLYAIESPPGLNQDTNEDIVRGIFSTENPLKHYEIIKNNKCSLGDVLFSECNYIRNHRQVRKVADGLASSATSQFQSHIAGADASLEFKKSELKNSINTYKMDKKNLLESRDNAESSIRKNDGIISDLQRSHDSLLSWSSKLDGLKVDDETKNLRSENTEIDNEIDRINTALEKHLRQHKQNLNGLSKIFSEVVRSVLSTSEYGGKISLINRELVFQITDEFEITGEAIETLAVLLADITCLIYSTTHDKARLPGFLIHDSPREGDLEDKIYNNFLKFAASIQDHFGEVENCPFQYIITTTSEPPIELQGSKFLKMTLDAAHDNEKLLRYNIAEHALV